ncbi:MAG: YlmC/YmxH family sporulation protein [bacterium]|nr:YlmC/YmxH family sporulation protein [bacterium]
MRLSELKEKEVVNIKSCKKIGYIGDLEIDVCTGCVRDIIVPERKSICTLFCSDSDCVIPFCQIKQIGPDIILVDIPER